MGKKSKKRSKATGNAGPLSLSDPSGRGSHPAAVDGLARRQRCTKCVSLIRDAANAAICPVCKDIYCAKCERKTFKGCPMGDDCVAPMRRCVNCLLGKSHDKMLRAYDHVRQKAALPPSDQDKHNVGVASVAAMSATPFFLCSIDSCTTCMCAFCYMMKETTDPTDPKTNICNLCSRIFCLKCLVRENAKRCAVCLEIYCGDCVSATPVGWLHHRKGRAVCSPCYFKAKACTNPSCPNDAKSTPTKRCGDCRCTRYCSKECQIAMYPMHKEECARIQLEREEKAGAKASRGLFAS